MIEDIRNLIIKPIGKIEYNKGKYLDQIDNKTYISSNYMSRYLRRKYNITTQEYYNLIMYGNINNTPKCYLCGKPREFIKLSHGYKVRCHECVNLCHEEKIKEYKEGSRSYLSSKVSKKQIENGTHNFINQDPSIRRKAEINSGKNTFIKRAKIRGITKSYLYCGITRDKDIKIGITFVGINRRAKALKLLSVHLLTEGTPEYISDLEYGIKIKFLDEFSSNKEVFKWSYLRKIIDFIKLNRL